MFTFKSYVKKKYDTDVRITNSKDGISLDHLVVPKNRRKQGVGTNVVQDLNKVADKLKKRVTLTPASKDDYHKTTSRSRLVKFYKRQGYVENKGRNKDWSLRGGTMYRDSKLEEQYVHTPDLGRIDISDAGVRVRINNEMKRVLDSFGESFVTPYVGIECIRKILAKYHIFIPGITFLDGEEGMHLFDVSQFGIKIGQHETGRVITKDEVEFVLKFTWRPSGGYYCCFAEIIRNEED